MGMFQNLTNENMESQGDKLGGFQPLASDVYDATIKVAYVGKASASNAQSITVVADAGGQEFRETIWITNRDGENFYVDKQDKTKKFPLPGFTTIDDLCLLATGLPLAEQDTEEKVVKIYNFESRKDEPTPAPVLTGLIGKTVKLGILRQIVDKQKKDDGGKYVNTGETRTENVIDKVFHSETGRTVTEYRQEVDPAEFMPAWIKRNKGKDRNRAKGAKNSGNGASGSGRPGASNSSDRPATKSLFG